MLHLIIRGLFLVTSSSLLFGCGPMGWWNNPYGVAIPGYGPGYQPNAVVATPTEAPVQAAPATAPASAPAQTTAPAPTTSAQATVVAVAVVIATPTAAERQPSANERATVIAGSQAAPPYIVGANPLNPYGANGRIPPPGVFRVQTGCQAGWFSPETGTCHSNYWQAGPNPTRIRPGNQGVTEVPAYRTMPGGVPGVPGVSMPMDPDMMGVPGWGMGGYDPGWDVGGYY